MHQREEENYLTTSILSFLVGSAIGAGLALLFAPQSGEYTRREMREKAERTIIRMRRMEDELMHALGDLMHSTKRKAHQLMDDGKERAELKRQEFLEVIAAGTKALEDARDKLKKSKQKG